MIVDELDHYVVVREGFFIDVFEDYYHTYDEKYWGNEAFDSLKTDYPDYGFVHNSLDYDSGWHTLYRYDSGWSISSYKFILEQKSYQQSFSILK